MLGYISGCCEACVSEVGLQLVLFETNKCYFGGETP
jgi:hypothetical protein